MAADLKARPTEYKGVLYRSKSEALFARYLELEMQVSQYRYLSCAVEYEPAWAKVGDYTFDFCRHRTISNKGRLTFEVNLIEFKPSKCTKTYLKQWMARCKEFSDNIASNIIASYYIYEGDFYTCKSQHHVYYPLVDSYMALGQWLDLIVADKVRDTRFDLEQSEVGNG